MRSILSVLAIALAAQPPGQTAGGGQVQGTVLDPAGASIEGVRVSVLQADSAVVTTNAATDRFGEFRIEILNPGSYKVRFQVQGFRARVVDDIAVREDEAAVLPDVHLDFAGCDAPGVNCDYFSNFPPNPLSAGYLNANLDCEIDLHKGQVYCPAAASIPRRTRAMDFKIAREDSRIFLKPLNGAALSAPNSSDTNCTDAKFNDLEVRMDGLGPGYDICVRTHEGYRSHVFLVNNIENTSSEITLWQVTRKR